MKSKITAVVFQIFIILFVVSATIKAQDFSMNVGADLVSRYIWRGIDVNSQPNIQPSISLSYSGFQAGIWGSYGLTHLNSTDEQSALNQEIDTWMSYSFEAGNSIGITLLLTDYYYPGAGIKIGNFNNYDNENGPGAHTIEAGVTITGPESLPLSLSGYINIYNDAGNNAYFQADFTKKVGDINLGVFAGAAAGSSENPAYYGTKKFNFINLGIKVSKEIKLTESFSLPVYGSFILNPNMEISYMVIGITL
jgi:uncharacterized protein (TIGR02001 family)